MLVIQRTEEGRLRLSDRRRTGLVDGEAEARRTLYHWGYTELSITKALAEMRRAEGSLPPLAPWRVTRPADRAGEPAPAAPPDPGESMKEKEPTPRKRRRAAEAAPAEAPPPEPSPRPAASRRGRKQAAASAPAPEPPPAPAEETPPPAAPARTRRAARPAPSPEADPLAQAQALFAEGTRVLRQIEAGTLPFARGPWTELRAQAEHILACLKG